MLKRNIAVIKLPKSIKKARRDKIKKQIAGKLKDLILAQECYGIPKPDLDSLHFCVVYPLKMMLAKKPSLNLHNFWFNSDIENFRTWLTALSNLSEDKLQEILLLPA